MTDKTCLAENCVMPADSRLTGLNLNEIVVGPTGCGKTFSNGYSRLLHTTESSVVVPIAKADLKDKFAKMFRKRGYKVIDLDFTNPGKCKIGYDPLDFIHNDMDVVQLTRNLVDSGDGQDMFRNNDRYWSESAISVLAAETGLVRLTAKDKGIRPSYADVIRLHRKMQVTDAQGRTQTNLDSLFSMAEKKHPGNQASQMWKTVQGLSIRTSSCIFSIVNSAVDKIFSQDVLDITEKEKRINFKELGRRKVALFITTSPMNKTLLNFLNLFYADMLRELFEEAQNSKDYRLKVPVHIICDDFACTGRISGFEDYISIFRAAGISTTMLLQSETQLENMYGPAAATTIINNCDTYVYMGGMDILTCEHIARKLNKPINKVASMPLEQVVVFRRGSEPFVSRRYQTLNDPLYGLLMGESEPPEIA